MKFKDLKAALAQSGPKPIYLLEGEDSWLLASAERQVRARCGVTVPELNELSFYGDETPFQTVREALEGLPFASETRTVTVREWYLKAAELESLAKFAARPFAGTVLLVANRKPSPDFKKKIPCEVVDCGRESEELVERWTAGLMRGMGVLLDGEAVGLLCAYCLYDMGRITSELAKLSDLARRRTVTRADIEENVAKEAEYQVFELTDSIQKRDGRAMRILEDLLGKNDAGYPVLVIGALFANFSRIYAVKTSGLAPAELAKLLKVKEYAVKMSARNGARFTVEQIEAALELINDYEYRFKSGQMAADIAIRQIVQKLSVL